MKNLLKVVLPIFVIISLYSCKSNDIQFCGEKWSLLKQSVFVADGNETWIEFLEARNMKKSRPDMENFIECISQDSLILTFQGITVHYNFSINGTKLTYGPKSFEIIELSDSLLVLKDNNSFGKMVYTNKLN